MISECKKYGMKPVCDHPSYCRDKTEALWIGQTTHLAVQTYRKGTTSSRWTPCGFQAVQSMWDNTCSYSATANGDYAYCQTSSSGAAGE